ncbi:heterokaryon incompatibility, partial [Acephala macrosclerotiorum]
DAPKYEAISYTWDDQETDQAIIVDGLRLFVTENARRVIEDRIASRRRRCLWIDAICINQKDDLEKSIQVTMMGQIYNSAAIVTV